MKLGYFGCSLLAGHRCRITYSDREKRIYCLLGKVLYRSAHVAEIHVSTRDTDIKYVASSHAQTRTLPTLLKKRGRLYACSHKRGTAQCKKVIYEERIMERKQCMFLFFVSRPVCTTYPNPPPFSQCSIAKHGITKSMQHLHRPTSAQAQPWRQFLLLAPQRRHLQVRGVWIPTQAFCCAAESRSKTSLHTFCLR
jgi:hypothetical protein